MNNKSQNKDFNPNGVGLRNGNFIGLPFDVETTNVVLLPVPWDVTASYGEGTALAPETIRQASTQLDLFDPDVEDAWQLGIYMAPSDKALLDMRNSMRPQAAEYMRFLEEGGAVENNSQMKLVVDETNRACEKMNSYVYNETRQMIENDKLVGLVGGDHSVPLGFLKALSEKYDEFGILQIDAHHDLRKAYEGFTWSHASVFYNALQIEQMEKLVQIGIRDYCHEEEQRAKEEEDRILVFYDQKIKENRFTGMNWNQQCERFIVDLPDNVYVSFDIDGLNPSLCPNTGTPVPGGLEFAEVLFLLKKLAQSGRRIIGFDVCETGNNEWDANVAARIIYKLCNLMGNSAGRI